MVRTIELQHTNGGTLLHFSQDGYAEADDTYALMTTGWAYYLVSLKQYLEKEKASPTRMWTLAFYLISIPFQR